MTSLFDAVFGDRKDPMFYSCETTDRVITLTKPGGGRVTFRFSDVLFLDSEPNEENNYKMETSVILKSPTCDYEIPVDTDHDTAYKLIYGIEQPQK